MAFEFHKDLTGDELHIPKDHTHGLTAIKIITGDYDLLTTDETVVIDGSLNTVDVTLLLNPVAGRMYDLKCKDSTNTVNILRNGKTIDGDASDFNLIEDESIRIKYDGTGWQIL